MNTNKTTHMEMVAVEKLVPYVNNARTHSPEQITKLRSSLREFGFINPVIIDKDYGALNTLLKTLGIISANVNWTPTPSAYFGWEIACGIFVTIPFVCFTALSGLQSIDSTLYEAATVDGSNYWQKLFHITLPLVKPSLTVSTVLNIIYVFNSFPIVWTISRGDPANRTDTLVTYLYKLAFYNGKQGEAAAVSVIGFVILLVCASIYMVSTLKKEDA